MNWEAIGAFGEVLGALAVFLTLIYLAVQVRQHTKSMEESRKVELSRNAQMRTENRLMMQKAAIDNEHVRNAIAKLRDVNWPETKDVLKALSHDEYESHRHYVGMQVLIIESIWFQGQQGLVDDALSQNTIPAIANFGKLWKEMDALKTVREEFRVYVDQVLDDGDS